MSEDLVTIAQFAQSVEAHLAGDRLADAGIEFFIQNENANTLGYWGTQVELQVATGDADRARALLHGQPRQASSSDVHPDACPACGSNQVERAAIYGVRLFNMALALLFWLPPFQHLPRWHCRACSHRWHQRV